MKTLNLLIVIVCCFLVGCKKNTDNIPGQGIVYHAKAYPFFNGDCITALDLLDISDPVLRRYVYGPPFKNIYHCLNDSAQIVETDTNYWSFDTLEITCRMPTQEEIDAQCISGKFVYVLKIKNLSLPHQR